MHELSLVQSLLDIIEEYRDGGKFRKVNVIRLSFGRLGGIEPASLRFAFDVASRSTAAEGAVLEFDILPVVLSCLTCGQDSAVESFTAECPLCGGEVLVTGGKEELRFLEMDVD